MSEGEEEGGASELEGGSGLLDVDGSTLDEGSVKPPSEVSVVCPPWCDECEGRESDPESDGD